MNDRVAPDIIGADAVVRRAVDLAHRFAPTTLPILLVGATGTGKDLLAQAIHVWSGRAGRLMDINCGAFPRELVDGLLFGHRRGAFTGAVQAHAGLIEGAAGGTLFLDELASLPAEAQVKLLRVLETGEVRRLGEATRRAVDFRAVSAVHDDFAARVGSAQFRLDLYQRLAGVVIELPPLSARGDDVVLLASHFASAHGRSLGRAAERALRAHGWPGNVRELKTCVERAVFLTTHTVLDLAVIAESILLGSPTRDNGHEDAAREYDAAERLRVLEACEAHEWNADRIAGALNIGRTTLFRRLKTLGISLRAGYAESSEYRGARYGTGTDGTPAR